MANSKKPSRADLVELQIQLNRLVESCIDWVSGAPYSYGEVSFNVIIEPSNNTQKYYYENNPDSDYGEDDIKPQYRDNPLVLEFNYKEQMNDFMVTIGCVTLPLQVMRKHYNDLCYIHSYDKIYNKEFYRVYLDMLTVLEQAYKKANK